MIGMANYYESLSEAVITGDQGKARDLTRQALDSGADPLEVINQGLMPGMNVVGVRFKGGQMFIPEVLMSARAMSGAMEMVKPLLLSRNIDVPSAGKVAIGTVKGDLHDIGKNLVAMMLESSGFTVINLGIDVPPEKFAQAVKEHRPDVLGMSALLTTTMLRMKDTIDIITEEGLRDKIKIIVGGAPISQDFADEIGADGFASDAAAATDLCKKLLM